MGYTEGVLWSLAGALCHTAIDLLRKHGSQRISPTDLVALVALYDAVIATGAVAAANGGLPDLASVPRPGRFAAIVAVTSLLAATARLLYQRALSVAPLSLTVPYLAFTPAFVVMISPLFLTSEVPPPLGLLGVFVVSVSGYLLGRLTEGPAGGGGAQPGSPSKCKLPTAAPGGGGGCAGRPSWPGDPGGAARERAPSEQLQLQLAAEGHGGWQQHHHQQQYQQQHQHQHQHSPPHAEAGQHHGGTAKAKAPQSVWALAYYNKHKALQAAAHDAPLLQLTAAAEPWGSGNGVPPGGGWGGGANGAGWDDSQAKKSKAPHHAYTSPLALLDGVPGKPGGAVARLLRGGGGGKRVRGPLGGLPGGFAGAGGACSGPALMLSVACVYSLTASMDKLGIAAAGYRLSTYFLAQRLFIGACALAYLAVFARGALRHLTHARDAALMLGISVVEQASVVAYLIAIDNILVSYVVAIKRMNVLASTLLGALCFGEHVRRRLPYIAVMLLGMLLIVLQPGHEDLHHSHHTRHRTLL